MRRPSLLLVWDWNTCLHSFPIRMTWTLLGAFQWSVNGRFSASAGRITFATTRSYAQWWRASLRRRREAIFGHVARMSPSIPTHQALRLQVEASVGRRPDRDWVRSSGRPRNRWIDQLRQDHQRPPADLWRGAIQRGHTGATLRSSTTTRWRRRRQL